MPSTPVHTAPLPQDALLQALVRTGAYTDCYACEMPGQAIAFDAYVEAFYSTVAFAPERRLLQWFANRPSTPAQAGALARGERDTFAAWSVEARGANQVLLCDFTGRTRSWLMTMPYAEGGLAGTRLYFGSAVVPKRAPEPNRRASMGMVFDLLLGFHRLYSRVLLSSAAGRLRRRAH